ncbi:hypothetical protein [Nonomuraea gerenzanensis]|uniref:Uncharacterized protein n=1 Tax=Nonomuraea gerenzanensis TaxID=93944 RepID=A0A1M4E0P3_9ACTN|nr:hypothetical protein [Nonomuraea gerenzanensis]UBU14665.1 hypothetical protein LCN96_06455 [Nonomuraea gerenzanensis]SBO92383.1 hypothetical protein BN4615_P1897 [Nonomuraea gerenzanensis]
MTPGTRKLSAEPLTFLAHAISLSALHGPGPWPPEAMDLPDEPPRADDGKLHLPSVVMDGVRTHHFGFTPDSGTVQEIAGLLEEGAPHAMLHDRLARARALEICDDLPRELARRGLSRQQVYEAGRRLAEHGTRREAVKTGIVLVGVTGDERDRELLLLLGTLEELTLYAVVALLRTQPAQERERAVFELARRVTGWGRIHAVERLEGSDDPAIRAWLLREGFRNHVMDEYLAPLAATTGDLYSALLDPEPDEALVDGAGGILSALARGEGGPTTGLDAYEDAVPALARYADLAAAGQFTLERLDHLLTIRGHLREPAAHWLPADVAALRRRYADVLAQPRWTELALAGVADPGGDGFGQAQHCALRLGLPILPQLVARLRVAPDDGFTWQNVLRLTDTGALVALAEELLPLDDLANGPGVVLGGDGHEHALELIVTELERHPGLGLPLIGAALRNRGPRVRRCALRALRAWPEPPAEGVAWVRAAHAVEPDEELRDAMNAFLTTCEG